MDTQQLNSKDGERGMIMILMAIAIVALIGAGSLAVDIGSALVTKSELQNVADASALAGTRQLAEHYEGCPQEISKTLGSTGCTPPGEQPPLTGIPAKAIEYASKNKAGGISISVANSGDVCLGHYIGGMSCPDLDKVRMVRVTSRRDGTSNGVLPTRLATVLGINNISVRATTSAALTPIGKLQGGQGGFPIAISKMWFDTHVCGAGDPIVLFPTDSTSCASWHTFDSKPSNAAKLRNQVDGIKNGTYSSPVTIAGKTFYEFIGGNAETACSNLRDLYMAKKVGAIMEANIPVYEGGCENANQAKLIIGFVKAQVKGVKCAPSPELQVTVECGIVGEEVGEGGGANDYGLLASSPSVVD
ncbi:MAG: Tad domain-containing protein [Candidatus Binatia bacterium]